MNERIRGGNGRLLVRLLDQYELSVAVLDRKGTIVFVNSALCKMASMEATGLVGRQCSWKIAADGPASAILTALAPPASALEGRASVRRLTVPIVFGAAETGQLFLPLVDKDGVVEFTLVVLGVFEQIQKIVPTEPHSGQIPTSPDRLLVQLRSRWKTLDQLSAMVGQGTAMQLAVVRAQMAIQNPCCVLIHGPGGVGKLEVAQGIYLGRLKAAAYPLAIGQFFPLDCRLLDAELIDGMLEIFSGRFQTDTPRIAQNLVLTGVDKLTEDGLQRLIRWLEDHHDRCCVMATSSVSSGELAERGTMWSRIAHQLSPIEINLPSLSDRREDIPALVLQALSEACLQADRAQLLLSAEASDRLVAYSWPGNIRQLRSAIQQAVQNAVLTSALQIEHLPVAIRTYCGAVASDQQVQVRPIELDAVLLDVERTLLSRALKLSPRNRAGAARLLGISRPRLLRRIEQLGLDLPAKPVDSNEE